MFSTTRFSANSYSLYDLHTCIRHIDCLISPNHIMDWRLNKYISEYDDKLRQLSAEYDKPR